MSLGVNAHDSTSATTEAFFSVMSFLVLGAANNILAFLAAILIAIGNGLLWPPLLALQSKAAGNHQGAVQGITGSFGASASILGLLLGVILYDGLKDWLFVLAASLISIIIILIIFYKPEKEKITPNIKKYLKK